MSESACGKGWVMVTRKAALKRTHSRRYREELSARQGAEPWECVRFSAAFSKSNHGNGFATYGTWTMR
jgi:hypothetical protein